MVEDPEVDATLPWSPEVPVVTLWEEQRVALEAAQARAAAANVQLDLLRAERDATAREHEAALAALQREVDDREAARQAAVAESGAAEQRAADVKAQLDVAAEQIRDLRLEVDTLGARLKEVRPVAFRWSGVCVRADVCFPGVAVLAQQPPW
jgi:hypothetical protein